MQRKYLSIDVGGTMIKYALLDHSGNIYQMAKVATPQSKNDFLKSILSILRKYGQNVTAVCVSIPGIVNHYNGHVEFTGKLDFMGSFNLAKYIQQQIKLPIYIGNDANCAALAELWLGNLHNINNGAVITLGTSVGCGLVINHQLLTGPHFRAGELGALITTNYPTSKLVTAGSCASAVKMIGQIAKVYNLLDIHDGKKVFELINRGDSKAWNVFEQFCKRVATIIINLQTILDLERVLLGGGISAQPIVLREVKKQLQLIQNSDRRLSEDIVLPEMATAKFGNEANLLGALYGWLLKIDH